jgi:hypothetical protein
MCDIGISTRNPCWRYRNSTTWVPAESKSRWHSPPPGIGRAGRLSVIITILPEAGTIQQGLYVDTLEIVKPGCNIALRKTLVCSDETQDNPADAALDGKLNTAWQVQTYPQSIEIDLGHVYPIDQTALFWEGAGSCQFVLEAKATRDDPYQLLVDHSTNTTPANLMKPAQDTFPTTDVRYVLLYFVTQRS